jgi:hypothetical protein
MCDNIVKTLDIYYLMLFNFLGVEEFDRHANNKHLSRLSSNLTNFKWNRIPKMFSRYELYLSVYNSFRSIGLRFQHQWVLPSSQTIRLMKMF